MGRRSIGGVLALTLSALKASAAAPRNDHCFLDKVNETVLTTRDLLDWPLDPLRPWWTRVVDARLDPKKCERSDYLSTKPEENASYTNAIDSVLTAAASVAAPALRHLLSEHRSDHLPIPPLSPFPHPFPRG